MKLSKERDARLVTTDKDHVRLSPEVKDHVMRASVESKIRRRSRLPRPARSRAAMSDADKPEAGRFIRPQDLDNAQRTTLGARIGWGFEAFAWDWVFWNPMKALPIETASGTVAASSKRSGR
jgi:hypothetical protein